MIQGWRLHHSVSGLNRPTKTINTNKNLTSCLPAVTLTVFWCSQSNLSAVQHQSSCFYAGVGGSHWKRWLQKPSKDMEKTVRAQTGSWKCWMKKLWGSKHRTLVMAVYTDSNMAGNNDDSRYVQISEEIKNISLSNPWKIWKNITDSKPVIRSPSCSF